MNDVLYEKCTSEVYGQVSRLLRTPSLLYKKVYETKYFNPTSIPWYVYSKKKERASIGLWVTQFFTVTI